MTKTTVNFDRGGGGADVDVNDQVNFSLLRNWRPPMSNYRRSGLGGASYYLDVVTELPFRIFGSSETAVKAKLDEIVALVDQVRLWKSGTADPVLLEYLTSPSSLGAAPQTLVLGVGVGREALLELPVDFNEKIQGWEINPVILPLTLRGGTYGAAETESVVGAANPTVRTANFADNLRLPAPVDIAVTGFADDTHLTINPGILLVTNDPNDIALVAAEALTATGWTLNADASNHPAGTGVLRYTPTGTAISYSATLDLTATAFNTERERCLVLANVRNNSGSRAFKLRVEVSSYVFDDAAVTRDYVINTTEFTTPTWIVLDLTTLRQGHRYMRLGASVDSISGTPTLDIDTVVLLAVSENSYMISHERGYLSSPFIPGGGADAQLVFEQRVLSDLTPFRGYEELTDNKKAALGGRGDRAIYLNGTDVATLWLSTNAAHWTDTNQSTGAIISIGMLATRRPVYLTPQ